MKFSILSKRLLWLILIFVFMFSITGCIYNDEPMPVITSTAPTRIKIPLAPKPIQPTLTSVPTNWYPPKNIEKNWTAIIIHHSATQNGNASIFDRWHREGRHWEGVGYDFVIGNGSDSSDGLVEVTFRWTQQKTGAHCGGTPGNWANKDAVGICLVGNFDQTTPTNRQMQSLLSLVKFLQKRYNIPKSRVYGHGTTPGAHKTDCPGTKFPMYWLKSQLKF